MVLDEVANVIVKNKKIARWTFTTKEQLKKLNLGNEGNPKQVLINAMLPISFQTQIKIFWVITMMSLLGAIKI